MTFSGGTAEMHITLLETEQQRLTAYQLMDAGGMRAQMLYDDDSPESWMRLTDPDDSRVYVVSEGETHLGVVLLNGFSGRTAFVHFCMLHGHTSRMQEAGEHFLDWSLAYRSCLIGFTPVSYRHVLRAIERLGLVRQCVVPDGIYLRKRRMLCDGVVTMVTRQSFEQARKTRQLTEAA